MKTTFAAALAATLFAAAPALAKEATTTLKVSGWHCQSCADKTSHALKGVKGVKEAKATKKSDSVTVTFDDEQTTNGALEEAIAALKYKVVK